MTPEADGPCPCWEHDSFLGHEGHCCFLTEDRSGWKADEQVCHVTEGAKIMNAGAS